ncbi:unnamed protein product [Aphanomyces euteiches]
MGIEGLPTQLKEAYKDAHVSEFKGQSVVIDALSWLHKACYGCAFDLALGKETQTYINYVMRRIDLLKSVGVRPILANTHEKRKSYKEANHDLAMKTLRDARHLQGDDRKEQMAKTNTYFQRSVNITSDIIAALQATLRTEGVEFVTAPFEADAQMVYLCKINAASAIITEDSDILVYSMTANISSPILLRMDTTGACKMVSREILRACGPTSKSAFLKKLPHFLDSTVDSIRMFVQMCVLSGCDFLDSLPNIGPVTAQKHIFAFRGAPGHLRVKRILAKLRLDKVSVPADYFDQFCRAEALFYHHYVFNPQTQRTEFLVNDSDFAMISDIHALACSSDATAFLGQVLPPDEMLAVYQCQRRGGSIAKEAAAPARALSHKEEEINEIHVVDLCTTPPSSPQVKMVTPIKRSIITPVNPKSAILGIVDQYRNASSSSGSQKRPRTDSPVQTNVEANESKTSLLFRTTEATPTHHSKASSSKSAVLPSKKRTSPVAAKSTAATQGTLLAFFSKR